MQARYVQVHVDSPILLLRLPFFLFSSNIQMARNEVHGSGYIIGVAEVARSHDYGPVAHRILFGAENVNPILRNGSDLAAGLLALRITEQYSSHDTLNH